VDEQSFAGGAPDVAAWKLAAARAAVAVLQPGMVVGLGSGTTAEAMLQVLGERVRGGFQVTGVPSSERTRAAAASLGIPLANLDDVPSLDINIDGADEVLLPTLDLVKGLGGALLREKLVATASRFRIIIVDASKLVSTLAAQHPVPVEVIPFGWRHTAARLTSLGARPVLRPQPGTQANAGSAPFVTDGGNYVLDCFFAPLTQPAPLAAQLKSLSGVVDHGLFIGMTDRVYAAGPEGLRTYDRSR
jgi:ribose 5-phosphate isomerase A